MPPADDTDRYAMNYGLWYGILALVGLVLVLLMLGWFGVLGPQVQAIIPLAPSPYVGPLNPLQVAPVPGAPSSTGLPSAPGEPGAPTESPTGSVPATP